MLYFCDLNPRVFIVSDSNKVKLGWNVGKIKQKVVPVRDGFRIFPIDLTIIKVHHNVGVLKNF